MSQYVRVYYSIVDDERFAGIFSTHHLATWLRLLLIADAIWPASAPVPASESRSSIRTLVDAGLIELLPGGRFRVHGLDAERGRRSESAAVGGRARQRSLNERSANAEPPLSLAEQSKAKPSKSNASAEREGLPNLTPLVSETWEWATGRSVLASGLSTQNYLDDACRRHKSKEIAEAIATARQTFAHIPDGPALVSAMRPILDPFVDSKVIAKVEREKETAKQAERRAANTLRDRHEEGWHNDSPDHRCPLCPGAAA